MSTINTINTSSDIASLLNSGDTDALLAHAQALSQSAISASQELQKAQQSKASVQFSSDTPTVNTTSTTIVAPTLSPPKISASSMMLMLMTLQTEANNEAVAGGLENAENQQVQVAQENEARANDMVGYYETMRQQEDVNGGMAIGNVILSAIMLATAVIATVVSAAFTIATGGGGVLALAASVAGLVAAASSFTSSIISLPQVQEKISEKGAKIATYVLGAITLAFTVISMVCSGVGAVKAVKGCANLVRKGCQALMSAVHVIEGASTVTSASMGIATSSINFKASEAQYTLDQHNTKLEELQADFDASIGNLEIMMDSYAAMVDSTAKMLENTMQGAKSAATLSA